MVAFGTILEETGLTMTDLKAAKMVNGTEEGLTVHKVMVSASTNQLINLSKLHVKVGHITQGHGNSQALAGAMVLSIQQFTSRLSKWHKAFTVWK